MNTSALAAAHTIWEYLRLHQELQKADAIIAFGSHDKRTAARAAALYLEGYAPLIIFSGNEGVGKEVSGYNGKPEAEIYRDIAIAAGVPAEAILIENKSTNSSENVLFVAQLIQEKNLSINTAIVVHKPYMERRAYATIKAQWPGDQPEIIMASPLVSFDEYFDDPLYSKEFELNTMVGDMQRIKVYAERGFQIPQDIPAEVWIAFKTMIANGYDSHLVH